MILVVGPYPPPVHGASRIASLVVGSLEDKGVDVQVVDTSTSVSGSYHLRRLLLHLRAAAGIAVARRKRRVVLYQTGAGGLGLWYQVGLAALARSLGIKRVFHHHSYAYLTRRSRAMRALVRVSGRAALHIVLSESMSSALKASYGVERVLVVPNALFLGAPDGSRMASSGPVVVGHLSNLSFEKGLGVVLESVVRLRELRPEVSLSLAGPAADDSVRAAIETYLKTHPQDTWHGALEVERVPGFMRDLDCFLFPSTYVNEALPLVVLESLREGTPVVATGVGALPELLSGQDWIAPAEAEAFAQRVQQVLANPRARQDALDLYERQFAGMSMDELIQEMTS